MPTEEKREFPRLYLKMEDGYFGNFRLKNHENLIAPIMNISAGGLNMAVADQSRSKLEEGDEVILQKIAGGTTLSFLSDIPAEIRWIRTLDYPGYVFVGCKFRGLTERVRRQLSEFVHTERMTRGQYG
jgi:c-di-GMP-binding flagellar brake protein YcgR